MGDESIQIKELLLENYRELDQWYANGIKRNESLVEPSDDWWALVTSDEFPPLKPGRVYEPENKESLNTALWLCLKSATDVPHKHVLIFVSDVSAKTVSMHFFAMAARCKFSELLVGSFNAENWIKLAAASSFLAEMDIQIIEMKNGNESPCADLIQHGDVGLIVLINIEATNEQMQHIAKQHDVPVIALAGVTEISSCNSLQEREASFSLLGIQR